MSEQQRTNTRLHAWHALMGIGRRGRWTEGVARLFRMNSLRGRHSQQAVMGEEAIVRAMKPSDAVIPMANWRILARVAIGGEAGSVRPVFSSGLPPSHYALRRTSAPEANAGAIFARTQQLTAGERTLPSLFARLQLPSLAGRRTGGEGLGEAAGSANSPTLRTGDSTISEARMVEIADQRIQQQLTRAIAAAMR